VSTRSDFVADVLDVCHDALSYGWSEGHTPHDVKQQMRRMVDAFATGNVDEPDTLIDPAYVDHQIVGVHGEGAFRRAVEAAHRSSAPRVEIADLIAEDDAVAVRLRWRWEQASGPDQRETIDIVRFRNGLAVEHWGASL